MNKTIRKIIALLALMMLALSSVAALAEEAISPYASQEISSASINLSKNKKITYNVMVTRSDYVVEVDYCSLLKKDTDGKFKKVKSMDDAIPESCTGNMLVSRDISSYITESGTYKVETSYTVGTTTRIKTSNERTF